MEFSKRVVKDFFQHQEYAVEEIYNQTFPLLVKTAYNILLSREEAENIVQETYLKALESSFSDVQGDFVAWLVVLCRNRALNRKRDLRKKVSLDEKDLLTLSSEDNGNDSIYEEFLLTQMRKILSEEEFEIVSYVVYHELTYKQISTILGQSKDQIAGKYHRAKIKLKRDLKL